MVRLYILLCFILVSTTCTWPCFDKPNWLIWLCLGRHKSHGSKNSKVAMSKLLGGEISELVLILLNHDFEIDLSWMNLERFLNNIYIPTRAKIYPHSNSCLCWALLWDVYDSRMSPDLLRGTGYVDWWRSRHWWWRLWTTSIRTRAVTTPWLRWLPTHVHMNWPRQEGYVLASESRTQARTGKNNLELRMND
jgi:hypothetical protein